MSYTSNPFAPNARMRARYDVLCGRLTITQAAAKYGVVRSTIWKWLQKSPNCNQPIFTLSSAPHNHPNRLKAEIVFRIITLRKQLKGRCAPVIHQHLKQEGIIISLSSVERTLRRNKLTRKKKPARWYTPLPRPTVLFPGALVQMDTIHFVRPDYSRFYVFTLIDVYSRLAYAEYHEHLLQKISFEVILRAQKALGFQFRMVQTDNGPEFKDGFLTSLANNRIHLRHSRVRRPNDNAHIERFNRTIQEECFDGRLPHETKIKKELEEYLIYYNTKRLHLSLNLQTPTQFVSKVLT